MYKPVGAARVTHREGCLSVNGFTAHVERYREVQVRGTIFVCLCKRDGIDSICSNIHIYVSVCVVNARVAICSFLHVHYVKHKQLARLRLWTRRGCRLHGTHKDGRRASFNMSVII